MRKTLLSLHVAMVIMATCASAQAMDAAALPATNTTQPPAAQANSASAPNASQAQAAINGTSAQPNIKDYPELDWYFLTHALAFYKPEIRTSAGLEHIYAYQQGPETYDKVAKNEFDLAELLNRYKADSAKYATQPPRRVYFQVQKRLGEYDHTRMGFPIEWKADEIYRFNQTRPNSFYQRNTIKFDSNQIPDTLYVGLEKDSAPEFLPLNPEAARALLQQQRNNRNIVIGMLVDFSGYQKNGNSRYDQDIFSVKPVWVGFRSTESDQWLTTLDEKTLAAERVANETQRKLDEARLAEEEKAKEAQRIADQQQAELEQRARMRNSAMEQYTQMLKSNLDSAKPAEKTALLAMPNFRGFSQTSTVLLANLKFEEPKPGTFLVQTKGSGRKEVEARWPGRLVMNVPESLEAMKNDRWYIVKGEVRAQSPKINQIVGQVQVSALYACEKDGCADFDNAKDLDERIHAMALAYANEQYPEVKPEIKPETK